MDDIFSVVVEIETDALSFSKFQMIAELCFIKNLSLFASYSRNMTFEAGGKSVAPMMKPQRPSVFVNQKK